MGFGDFFWLIVWSLLAGLLHPILGVMVFVGLCVSAVCETIKESKAKKDVD